MRVSAACDSSPRGFKVDWETCFGDCKVYGAASSGDFRADGAANLAISRLTGKQASAASGLFATQERQQKEGKINFTEMLKKKQKN